MILWGNGWSIWGGVKHSCDCGELWCYQADIQSLPPPYLGDTERVGGMNINMVSCFYQSIRAHTITPLNILLLSKYNACMVNQANQLGILFVKKVSLDSL